MTRYIILRLVLNFFELAACVTGFIYWKKIRTTYWKWFPVYLGLIFLTEIVAELAIHRYNNELLNLSLYKFWGIPLQILFFCWLFGRSLKEFGQQHWAIAGALTYLVFFIIEIMFHIEITGWFLGLSYTVGIAVLLILFLVYFIYFSNSKGILQYRQSMMFWVSLGIILFYLITMPYWGLRNTLWEKNRTLFFAYMYLSIALDCCMYLCFAFAFIWGKPK